MTNSKPKIKAVANIAKNRLHIVISGNIDAKSLEKIYTDIRFCVCDLKNGFEVIEDASQCNLLYISSLPVYKKIMDYLIANNVGEVVRITKNDNISYKQILNFSDKILSYKTIHAKNKEEAENKLENLIKRNGVRFSLNEFPFVYEVKNEPGQGHLIDISTSGCAFESNASDVSIGSELYINLYFDEHASLLSEFKIKAEIVRANDRMLAVQFLDLDDDRKEQLYNRLAYEISRAPVFLDQK